jgi:hypothetical protein
MFCKKILAKLAKNIYIQSYNTHINLRELEMITITPVNFKSYKSNSKKNSIKNVSFEANAVKEVVKKLEQLILN